jgi:predicted dinucleotide-binding enzyme/uncharacterized protein YciI
MRISVIGSGRMGIGLIKSLASVYSDLLWVGRDRAAVRSQIQELGLEERVEAASHAEGLQAEIIILAMWHRDLEGLVQQYRPQLAGKIVVNIANPFTADFNGFTTPWESSAAEEFQRLLPEARVVGAFKNTFWVVFDDPSFPEGASDCYVTSDDEEAKRVVMAALQPLPFRVLDAGRLSNNRTIERMTLLAREIAVRYGFYPRVTWRLLGQETRSQQRVQYLVTTTRTARFDPAYAPAHYAYLNRLQDEGRLESYGPFSDSTGGAYLLKVDSLEEAEALANADPLVDSGSSTASVKAWTTGRRGPSGSL